MEHVQMLKLVACFLLLNFAQTADENLVLRNQFPRHQETLLMIEHRRRQRHRARRHNPYFWELPRPNGLGSRSATMTEQFPGSFSEGNCEWIVVLSIFS